MLKLYKSDILEHESAREASRRLILLAAKEFCKCENPTVLKTEHGKPYFADLPIKFSVSHSARRVIVAVSDSEIGADIQKVNARSVRIAKRFFTDAECEYVGCDTARFFEIWTKKEAYAKWDGRGFVKTKAVDVTKLDFYTETDGDYVIAVYEK